MRNIEFRNVIKGIGLLAAAAAVAGAGGAEPWQVTLQEAATPVMAKIHEFNTLLFIIISLISAFVLGLLVYVIYRFGEKRNPVPSKTSHNTLIEVLWTVVPIMILVLIAIPSFRLLYLEEQIPEADMTLKVTGHQWYWSYEYPDHGDIAFDAFMLADDELEEGQPRLLATDEDIVLPVDTTIRVLITADDVLHSWAMPAFGVKMDAVPGRINETWMRVEKEGMYYGMCSELCGVNHGFMPIAVKVVSKQDFEAWVTEQRAANGHAEQPTRVADAAARD